jgi:putative transposase
MKKRKAYLFTLKTDLSLERQMSRYAGSCRFVWNRALALEKDRLDAGEKILRYNEMAKQLVAWKREPETAWLCESPSHTLQQTLRNLDRALMEAFDKKNPKRFPKFKKKASMTVSGFRTRSNFAWIRPMAGSSSQSSDGSGTERAATSRGT